ncbi:hypothetical protein [Microvirga sp. TS319]|uniref:hypothetical protein n=1 Tax=Microvirga sp. TS319 TaxID=3241165 RepID=UPI00351A5F48
MVGLEAFQRPETTINWAKEAIDEVCAGAVEYFSSGSFQLVDETEADGVHVHKLVQVRPLPEVIPQRATEALNNIGNAFDQTLFAACAAIGRPGQEAHYPWADNPGKDLKRRLEGNNPEQPTIPPEFWDIIQAHEPYPRGEDYPGGDDLIRDLAKIANRKHAMGVLVQCKPASISFPGVRGSPGIEWVSIGGDWDPLKNELVLARYKGTHVKFGDRYEFVFGLSFDVPPPAGNVNVPDALGMFLAKAQSVLDSFNQRCAELGSD